MTWDELSGEDKNYWRGYIDGITAPNVPDASTAGFPESYRQGHSAGRLDYWSAYNEELKKHEGPF